MMPGDLMPPDQMPEVRGAGWLQMAHDMLRMIELGEIPTPPGYPAEQMKTVLDTLCWALKHDDNPAVATALYDVDHWLRANGFELRTTAGAVPPFPKPSRMLRRGGHG